MKFVENKSVYYEKYKPQCLDDLILPDSMKKQIKSSIQTQNIPNLGFFSSSPGTGKSSTCHAILKEIGGEALWINASLESGIDMIRGKLLKFASQTSFDDKVKVVVLDEADNLSQSSQAAFRGFIDEYSQNCRFIFTGNYKEKMIEPLLDRLNVYDFNNFKRQDIIKQIVERMLFICENENITYEKTDLQKIIQNFYPCIRSMVGALQKFNQNGVLKFDDNDLDDSSDFQDILDRVKEKNFYDMVSLVNKLNSPESFYSFLYGNLDDYFKTTAPNAIVTIAKYQHMSATVRDKNLNLSACLTELMAG